MLFEPILLGATLAMTSILVLSGCSSKKKAAPSVAKSPANNQAKSPVKSAASPAKETQGETKDTQGETKDTQGGETKDGGTTKGDETKQDDDETKGDKKDDKKEKEEKDDKKKDKKKSDEKEDEKKDEDGEKKKEEDEKDEDKKEDDKDKKKKETYIRVDPTELVFETAITSQKKLRLKNLSSKKVMFKIKATTTNVYLINPVFGKIEPNNFTDVMITHRPSAKREDKLVIVSSEMLGKEIEMAKTFKQIKTTGADVTVKLVAS